MQFFELNVMPLHIVSVLDTVCDESFLFHFLRLMQSCFCCIAFLINCLYIKGLHLISLFLFFVGLHLAAWWMYVERGLATIRVCNIRIIFINGE
jgi:hypothetical protein